jgi:uncharacterized membrane protein
MIGSLNALKFVKYIALKVITKQIQYVGYNLINRLYKNSYGDLQTLIVSVITNPLNIKNKGTPNHP